MAAMTTSPMIAPAVPAAGPAKGKKGVNPFAKKGAAPGKSAGPAKKGVNPFAKKGAAPSKGKPIDPKTLGSMKASLKGV